MSGLGTLQRFTATSPCPVCSGHPALERGTGRRCFGFLSADGAWAHCTRLEAAGSLPRHDASGTFAHRLRGRCACGNAHGEAVCRETTDPGRGRTGAEHSRRARELWSAARPIAGTVGAAYLRRRGITIAPPASLRFAELWHAPSQKTLPAIAAGVQNSAGRLVALHRTFLELDGSQRIDKRMLGPVRGGAVRLARAGEELAVAEGLETALSVQQATGLSTWAALSAPGLAALELPPLPLVSRVVIVADGDRPGLEAAARAGDRWIREGRRVRIARPADGSDANDLLRGAA